MKKQILIYGGLLLIGGIIGFVISNYNSKEVQHDESVHEHSQMDDNEVWTCSMHPQIRKSESGQCPICAMDLILLETDKSTEDPEELKMSPTAMQLANVQTLTVRKLKPIKEVKLNGKVAINETKITKIPAHFHGRIEKLYINYTGEKVMHGQLLAEVYSPELATAQQELHLAYLNKTENPIFYQNARAKLGNWKISKSEIDRMESSEEPISRFKIHAHHGGVVVKRMVAQGDHVRMGDILFEVADLRSVWVQLDIHERDLAYVKVGNQVKYMVSSYPGEIFKGSISFIDPIINAKTRVAKARISVENKGGRLKPEMFLTARISSSIEGSEEVIIIPKTSVMWTGERSIVYVKVGKSDEAIFKMREVVLGESLGDLYVIKEGLQVGEEIVSNGAFSIDAAAQLAGKPSMMNPDGGQVRSVHDHGSSNKVKGVELNNSSQIIGDLFLKYIKMKDELANDDLLDAIHFSKQMKVSLKKVDMSFFKGNDHVVWMEYEPKIDLVLSKIIKSTQVKSARVLFVELSNIMISLTEKFNVNDGPIYIQHCPMANDNQGADWLSLDKEIQNPYFGKSMLKCGSVKKVME